VKYGAAVIITAEERFNLAMPRQSHCPHLRAGISRCPARDLRRGDQGL